ncbi:MAG TPA: hypothetical protein VN765_11425 [Candidatus Acidoferrum sp.]|nr:hypothetical protein [Candidatus Acidoferrum sp.]
MSNSQTPAASSPSKRWTILRRCLIGLAIFLTVIAAFYTEESWRGKRAWENCKRALEAKGLKMDWAQHIPPPVPDDQNVFAVPAMQKWFVGWGNNELSKKISDLQNSNLPSARIVVAEVAIGLPASTPPSGFTVISYGDAQGKAELGRAMEDAVGRSFIDPIGLAHTTRRPVEMPPAKIFLQCQSAPTAKELEQFLPRTLNSGWRRSTGNEEPQVGPAGSGSYQVTMLARGATADYLAQNAALEPEFNLIRQALRRPYTRINGDYQVPYEVPIPNFVVIRTVVQRLATLAQCHLAQGQPEEALRDLTLLNDLCRVLESRPSGKPMTLVASMIHVAVSGLYTSAIADGLAWHAWQEPQLLALQEQLKEINLLPDVTRSFEEEPVAICHTLETMSPAQWDKLFQIASNGVGMPKATVWQKLKAAAFHTLLPRGWIFQNMVQVANGCQAIIDCLDPAHQMVFPKKVDAVAQSAASHHSPYTFLATAANPNMSKAMLITTKTQTLIHEALIACALERYRLAHNSYPETLDTLIPQYLDQIPPDLIGGQPLHYRRAGDNKFLLYSIGWNEKDDGGKPGSDDDWVWDDTAR